MTLTYKNCRFVDNNSGRKVEKEKFVVYAHNNKAHVDTCWDEVQVSREIKTLADVDALLNFLPKHDEFFLCAWNFETLSKLLEKPKKPFYKYPLDNRANNRAFTYRGVQIGDNFGYEFRLRPENQYGVFIWDREARKTSRVIKDIRFNSLSDVDKLITPEVHTIYCGVQTFEEIKALVEAEAAKPKPKRGRPRTKTPDGLISAYQARRQADNVYNLQNALELERKQKLAYRDERDELKAKNDNQADIFRELLRLLPKAELIHNLPNAVRNLQHKLDRARAVLDA